MRQLQHWLRRNVEDVGCVGLVCVSKQQSDLLKVVSQQVARLHNSHRLTIRYDLIDRAYVCVVEEGNKMTSYPANGYEERLVV